MAVSIIPCNLSDLDRIVELDHEIFTGLYPWQLYSLQEYRQRLHGTNPMILVASKENKWVGSAIAFSQCLDFYLWVLGVKEEERKQGVGSMLMDRIEVTGQKQGLSGVIAKVYNVSSEMQSLLKKRGYTPIDVEKAGADSRYHAVRFRLAF